MSFVHLHRHSEWSLLDGTGTAKQWAAEAARRGQPALSVNDHGTLSGVLQHIEACVNRDDKGKPIRDGDPIMPIVGVEAYYRPNRLERDKENRKSWHLNILAKDIRGWRSMMRLISESHRSGFYQKPCVDLEILERHSEGLIVGTSCMGGWLCHAINQGDDAMVRHWLGELTRIFGEDVFVEIMPNGIPEQRTLNIEQVNVAKAFSLPVVATVDAHYPYQEWADTQDVLLMISTNQTVKKRERKKEAGEDVYEFGEKTLYLMSEEEVRASFAANHPELPQSVVDESIANTVEIASRIRPWTLGHQSKLPHVTRDLSTGEDLGETTPLELLNRWCREGMDRIGKSGDEVYEERLRFEMQTFIDKDVVDYFVLVGGLVRWARSQGVHVGSGRGSAAGSLVSYLCQITMIDPISYELMFERFLNPSRKGMPDIDIDFPPDKVDMVERYLVEQLGEEHVLDIISHQTFGPRAALRDVGRVLCAPHNEIDTVCKTIDENSKDPLEEIRVVNKTLDKFAQSYPEVWKHATRLQSQAKAKSEHAGGVVVTDRPVTEYMPVERKGGQKGKLLTAWGETTHDPIISSYGFMKIDILRVIGLAKQQMVVDMVREKTGEEIDLHALPHKADPRDVDEKVMQAFSDGMMLGVFQFDGSRSIVNLTRRVKPDWIGDLAAINALHRPGPMGAELHRHYVERKHGREPVSYWHESLEPFFRDTYGLMVFQEQLIEAAHQLAGFSRTEADNFRKIASKLYRDPKLSAATMGTYHDPFIQGCWEKSGIREEDAEEIWKNFLSFSDYSFNRAHSAGYSVQGYDDMWLKVYYTDMFYASTLSHPPSKKERAERLIKEAVREARANGIEVLPPDVNRSDFGYTVVDGQILFGLKAVKNVADATIQAIMEKRPYVSFEDFEQRVEKRRCNSQARASLVLAGAFDWDGQRDDFTPEQVDEAERDYLGVSLTSSISISAYKRLIEERIYSESEFEEMLDDEGVTVAGEIVNVREINDRKGKKMAFVDLVYGSNQWSCTFFSHVYPQYRELIESGRPIIVRGRKDTYNGRSSVIVDQAMDLSELAEQEASEHSKEALIEGQAMIGGPSQLTENVFLT